MTVGKTKKADLIICNHLAVKSSIVNRNPSNAPRYKEGLLMGYVDGTHNYRIWDTKSNSVITSRDVMFTHHSPTTSDIAPDVGPKTVQVPDDDIIETTEMPVSPHRQLLRQFSRSDQQETLRPIPDNIDDDDPLNLQPLDEGGIDPRLFSAHALLASTTAPQSYLQARHSGEWEQWEPAMQEELAKMDKYKVWEVVPRSPDMRVVGARWVYTRKIDGETGKPSAYKARWVAKGFSQIEGIDFNDFAAVAHIDSIREFLSLVNLDLERDQRYQSGLPQWRPLGIYLAPPEGNISADKVLHLRKRVKCRWVELRGGQRLLSEETWRRRPVVFEEQVDIFGSSFLYRRGRSRDWLP